MQTDAVFRFDIQDQQDVIAHPLMEQSALGHVDAVQGLIASGMDVNMADGRGNTALHYAATNNRFEVVKVLLELGADPLVRNLRHDTPLHNAKVVRSQECLSLFALWLSQKRPEAPPLRVDPAAFRPGSVNFQLASAVDSENVAAVFSALTRGANANLNIQGYSILSLAARYACAATLRMLLQWGANANVIGEHLISPLYIAVANGRQENVSLLLKYNASVTSADPHGRNPAHIAALRGHVEILEMLVKHNPAIIESRCANGRTPLHYAALGDQPLCVSSALAGARLDIMDLDGRSPLHLAVSYAPLAVVEAFLALPAMTLQVLTRSCADVTGDTAFHFASRWKHGDVVTVLTDSLKSNGGAGNPLNKAGALPEAVWGIVAKSQVTAEKTPDVSLGWALDVPLEALKLQDRMFALAKQGRLEDLDDLLRTTSVDINGRGSSTTRDCALHLCVADKSPARALLLFHRGASVNATNDEGVTPLHQACMVARASVFVPLLLRFGADPSLCTRSGLTAMMLAVKQGQTEALAALLQNASIETVVAVNATGDSVFHILGRITGSLPAAKQLLALPVSKEDLNRPNRFGETPLVVAVRGRHWDLVSLLVLDFRIDINVTARGTPVISLMIQSFQQTDDLTTLETFLSRKADLRINAVDVKGYTPLHHAFKLGNDAVIAMLVSTGADGTLRTVDGLLPADLREDKKTLGGRITALFSTRRGGPSRTSVVPSLSTESFHHDAADGGDNYSQQPQHVARVAFIEPNEEEEMAAVMLMMEEPPVTPSKPPTKTFETVLQGSPLQKLKRSLGTVTRKSHGESLPPPFKEDVGGEERDADDDTLLQQQRQELLPDLTRLVEVTARCRAYVPMSKGELPPAVRAWREDIGQIRLMQQQTLHREHSLELEEIQKKLDVESMAVEEYVVRPDYTPDLLDRMVERRDQLRQQAAEVLHQALVSGMSLSALQIEEEERILAAGADRREDDPNVDAVDGILERCMDKVDRLSKAREKTNALVVDLLRQLAREQQEFESWRTISETLTTTQRLVDMRRSLAGVKREKVRQEQWIAQNTQQQTKLVSLISNRESAQKVAELLTSATRTLQRRQLELEEAHRFRELLQKEGQVAEQHELLEAEERVRVAKEKFHELKHAHSSLVERANELGREGFPEVWRGVGHAFRGGALLTIDSFANLKWIRSPDVRSGEKDGRTWVLKMRVLADRRDRSKLEKELFILRRVRHPLIIQMETVFCQGETAYMVFPYYPDGTMQQWLKATSPSRVKLCNAFHGVCQALTYLHSNGIVHADLKLENILMNGDRPVLNDFDISRDATYVSANTTTLWSNPGGTLTYMAPELFEPNAVSTMEADMWSFGICIFTAFFPEQSPYLAPRAPHVAVPADTDGSVRALLEALLDRDPSLRPSADEALSMDFFHERPETAVPHAATREAFREHLHLLRAKSSRGFAVRWKINPADIVASTCTAFLSLGSSNCLKMLRITFEGEKGSDGGGLTTSLYRRLFAKMLDPQSGLFETRGGGTYLPLFDADCAKMEAIGVAAVRAIFDERIVELPLASAMFKFLYNVPVDMSDLEAFDEQQGNQLKQLQRCPSVKHMELTFGYCGGSDSIVVTDHNKDEFCQQKIRFDLIDVRTAPLEAFKRGFWSLAPLVKPLSTLTYRDIVVLLCGDSFVSAEMLLNVLLFEGFGPSSNVPVHLRSVIEEMSADDLRLFLYFATEQPAIPFGGLRNPRGHAPVDRITIRHDRLASISSLPTASVCFYLVNIPEYPNPSVLKEKLLMAIRESGSSFERR